jgi:hypothetical protein
VPTVRHPVAVEATDDWLRVPPDITSFINGEPVEVRLAL